MQKKCLQRSSLEKMNEEIMNAHEKANKKVHVELLLLRQIQVGFPLQWQSNDDEFVAKNNIGWRVMACKRSQRQQHVEITQHIQIFII